MEHQHTWKAVRKCVDCEIVDDYGKRLDENMEMKK
jgi:hypothetical protein